MLNLLKYCIQVVQLPISFRLGLLRPASQPIRSSTDPAAAIFLLISALGHKLSIGILSYSTKTSLTCTKPSRFPWDMVFPQNKLLFPYQTALTTCEITLFHSRRCSRLQGESSKCLQVFAAKLYTREILIESSCYVVATVQCQESAHQESSNCPAKI